MASIIKNPKRYISPFLKEGEDVVVHILQKTPLINLTFLDKKDSSDGVQSLIEVDVDTKVLTRNEELQKELASIEGRMLNLGGLYLSYAYLFIIKNKELHLMSVSLDNKSFSFNVVQEIAEALNIKTITPVWKGKYTPLKISAFIEDIFIQKQ